MKERARSKSASTPSVSQDFEIVAMAASAGGLTALGHVLSRLPADFSAAIVVVQHLDPRHRSLMAEILDKRTSLEVRQAQEGDSLRSGTVYIAPPDHHFSMRPYRAGPSAWCR